ncbi:MAG TPA: hypothetical protein VIN74_11160 [Candidatus Limnocylindria bacterium]
MIKRMLLVATLLLGSTTVALGHEQHRVGKYTVEMGWRDEPALEGAANAVYLEVLETATGTSVEGLAKTLRVQVSFGGGAQSFEPPLQPLAGTPGAYVADIIPTRAGDYIFHLIGTIDTVQIDERFESGPARFDPVMVPNGIQFPDQLGSSESAARELQAVRDSETATRLIAIAALLVGAVGIGLAVATRRRSRGDASSTTQSPR